jgi:hypothetical protein
MGIISVAVEIVAGEPAKRKSRCVGAADNDSAGFSNVGNNRAIGFRDQILLKD